MGYWVICIKSYQIDGKEINKGCMDYHNSTRPITNADWRLATDFEIENKQHSKSTGNYYLPPKLWNF